MNIAEILKDCPKGTRLYSPAYGEIYFKYIQKNSSYPIIVEYDNECLTCFTSDGKLFNHCNGECMIFPSKENRDWSTFKVPEKDYDLKPFDKVLVRDSCDHNWRCEIFLHKNDNLIYPYKCIDSRYKYCIPYEGNEHLLGTSKYV